MIRNRTDDQREQMLCNNEPNLAAIVMLDTASKLIVIVKICHFTVCAALHPFFHAILQEMEQCYLTAGYRSVRSTE